MRADANLFRRFTEPYGGGLWSAGHASGANGSALWRERVVHYRVLASVKNQRFAGSQTRHGQAARKRQGVSLRVDTPVTVAGALTVNGLEAVMSLDGALNRYSFAACFEHVLGPMLVTGDVVVLDNLRVHHIADMAGQVEARGANLLFLSPYSPNFAPIERV